MTITNTDTNENISEATDTCPLMSISSSENSHRMNFEVEQVSDPSKIKFEFFGYKNSGRKTYKCLLCGRVVRERSEHKVAHISQKTFKCSFKGCDKVYKRRQGLRLHEQIHISNLPTHKCNKCGKSYRTAHLLYKHKTATCFNDRSYTCRVCGKKLKTPRQLKYHEAMHCEVKSVNCEICQKAFASEQHLQIHLSTHDSVTCFCGKSFNSWTECKSHKKQEHLCESEMFKIKSDNVYSNKDREILHPGQVSHECTICEVKFKKKTQLDLHMLNHAEPDLKCPECEKKFKTKAAVKSHLQSHNKRFECTLCGVRFAALKSWEKHQSRCVISKTDKRVKFSSSYFSQTFNTVISAKNDTMENQEESSASNAIYNCELCSAVFQLEESLVKHEIKKHSANKDKYRCPVCNVLFITTRTLWKHKYYEHKLGEIYFCDKCEREFFHEKDLVSHKLSVHSTFTVNQICYS